MFVFEGGAAMHDARPAAITFVAVLIALVQLIQFAGTRIAADGPFSPFPGVQRWFAVLSGAGVQLGLADGGKARVLDWSPNRVTLEVEGAAEGARAGAKPAAVDETQREAGAALREAPRPAREASPRGDVDLVGRGAEQVALAGVGLQQAGEDREQGGLAGPVGADQADDAAGGELEVDAAEHDLPTEALGHGLQGGDRGVAHALRSHAAPTSTRVPAPGAGARTSSWR